MQLRGIVHFGLIMLFEAARQILSNKKEKVRVMINIQQPVVNLLKRIYIRFSEVVCATVWAFGVEAAVVH
jgi:hypothetical protein